MIAMPIQWHEKTLCTFTENLEYERRILARQQEKVDRWAAEIIFRQKQIDAAKAKGKEAYDPDKFLGGFKWTPLVV